MYPASAIWSSFHAAIRRHALRFALCVAAAALPACDTVGGAAAAEEGLVGELAAMRTDRVFAPRLSIPQDYRPCTTVVPPGGTIATADCGAPGDGSGSSAEVRDVGRRIRLSLKSSDAADALHAGALFEMMWSDGAVSRLHRAISYLRAASNLAERPALVLTDLSAALLVLAERTQNARYLREAAEHAQHALELEPWNLAARFNHALALDRQGLDAVAAQEWTNIIRADARSGWAKEARRMREALSARGRVAALPPRDVSAAELRAYATRAPQEARVLALDSLLGDWGGAVLVGDSARAGRWLRGAAVIGDALERAGRDASVADAVRAIRAAATDAGATRRLAEAHRAYAAGIAAYWANDREEAQRRFDSVLAFSPPSPALVQWTRAFQGATLVYRNKPEGEFILRETAFLVDSVRHPALAGRARWNLATTLLRIGQYDEALHLYRRAARHFRLAGEREHLGAVQYMAGEAEFALGDELAADASLHEALMTLRPYRESIWLHNLLLVSAQAAALGGLSRTATRMLDEGVAVSERNGRVFYRAEARLWRARLRSGGDRVVAAAKDINAARDLIKQLPRGVERDWALADLRFAEAGLLIHGRPEEAVVALDSASKFFARNPLRLIPVLVRRAEARSALDQAGAAEKDLARAAMLLRGLRGMPMQVSTQASMIEAESYVVDRLVMLRVNGGRAGDALADLEQGRVSFIRDGEVRSPGTRERIRAPEGQVAVVYALIGDTLLTWTVSDTVVRLDRRQVNRDELLGRIERARSLLELREGEAALRTDLAALYEWLIRPVQGRMGAAGTPLVVIADGELASVPFDALYDARQSRYLIETHVLRYASTLADARQPARRVGVPPWKALFVADPTFDAREYPGLQPLPVTAAQVRAIAATYPSFAVVTDTAAHRKGVSDSLRHAALFHFAGHAVFDDERPTRSYLVLASRNGDSGRLTAAELEEMKLWHVDLVVLSACETQRSGSGRSGGFLGLTGAMLAAGAGGVVGSLWRVDEALTGELMVRFHRFYRDSGDAAAALRRAQLELLRSGEPDLHSPAAWAGFRYVGG